MAVSAHPMMPYTKGDEIDLQPHIPLDGDPPIHGLVYAPNGQLATYRPTLPPVAHDPLNMREETDLKSLYPKLADLAAVQAETWGKDIKDPVERALRKELGILLTNCTESLNKLAGLMRDQHTVQAHFNLAYGAIETILAKFPELLKP